MKKMKLEKFNNNHYIIKNEDAIYFISYESNILKIDKKGFLTLGVDWDYSNTTLKNLYDFLSKYDYYFNNELRKKLNFEILHTQTNKKAYIQSLIDEKIIKFNVNL